MHDTDPLIRTRQFFCYGNRLGILIKYNQPACITQTGQNQPGMSSPAERTVHINTILAHGKRIYSLMQQNRNMPVTFCFTHNCKSV